MTLVSRLAVPVVSLPLLAMSACGGASSNIDEPATGGDSGTGGVTATGSTSSSGGTGAGSGGQSTGQGGVAGGTGGSGGTACSSIGTLTIDASGRVDRACNDWGIEGNWYCFDDNVNPTSCIDGKTPYRASAAAMCLSGYTTVDPTFAAYGATLGLSLNSTVGAKAAYNAAEQGVTGFRIQVSGELGGHPLRVIFTGSAEPGMSPFVEVNGTGSFDALIADAVVPTTWSGPEAGEHADPSNVWDIRFQIPVASRLRTIISASLG